MKGSDPGNNSATFLALAALLAIAAGLLVLMALVMPSIIGIPAVVCGFFFFGAFHYVVWGWWMSRSRFKDDDTHK